MLGVGEPSGGLLVTRLTKSERSTLLPHTARTATVAAREGRSMLRFDSFLTAYQVGLKPLNFSDRNTSAYQLIFVCLKDSEHHFAYLFCTFFYVHLLIHNRSIAEEGSEELV